jgi:hypothetical protein
MAVRKICKPKGCRGSPRCDHPWWFDVMCRGKRWRMRVDEFAFARGATESVASKQTAERVWEPKFVAEIMAGADPRVTPTTKKAESETLTVAEFLDRYVTNYVEAEGLQDPTTIKGRLKAVKAVIGIIGALETCCRKGEMLRIQNRHVDWERFQIAIPGANAKDSENRRVPFDPQGRLMLGHADIKQTQRYLNITDEELRRDDGRLGTSTTAAACGWLESSRAGRREGCGRVTHSLTSG